MNFAEYLHDPLHGAIGITEKEQAIIRTKAFQRLKRITQLGTANFVYPGANHSRFEHSIGAMHTTWLVLERLRKCSDAQKQSIRIAALLHDIGHGPFSHTFEELLNRNEEYVSTVGNKQLRGHENFNEYILANSKELASTLGNEREKVASFLFEDKPVGFVPSELVTGDIGADRIDYLLRDTYYTGLGHRPDVHSLISHMRISSNKKGHPRLALVAEGILSAELLITTRYYHYSMIVHNPKARSVEFLFLRLMEEFLKKHPAPKEYLFKAFTEYDDSAILNDLFRFKSPLRDLFYSGRSFSPVYNVSLSEIRSGLTKYCIYRFFTDRKGLMDYIRQVGSELRRTIVSNKVLFDVHLFRHDVPDIILYADTYETEKEWISSLLLDRSKILRSIPSEQLLRSLICIMSEQDLTKGQIKEWNEIIESKRDIFLGSHTLIPITRASIDRYGFRRIDEFYTFLCALRDFYAEKPWKETIRDCEKEESFRGISRFYDLAHECFAKTGKPNLRFQEFFKAKAKPFTYSTQGFSILNALAFMDILRMDYVPVKGDPKGKPFHFTYIIRPVELAIRNRVYGGLPAFDELRSQFIEIFRKLDWKEFFAEFFPLKSEGI